jgi:hypothetical protein
MWKNGDSGERRTYQDLRPPPSAAMASTATRAVMRVARCNISGNLQLGN